MQTRFAEFAYARPALTLAEDLLGSCDNTPHPTLLRVIRRRHRDPYPRWELFMFLDICNNGGCLVGADVPRRWETLGQTGRRKSKQMTIVLTLRFGFLQREDLAFFLRSI